MRRLGEIMDEVGPLGQFLEKVCKQVAPLASGPEFENRLATSLNRARIPGFCGYKLLVEASTLMELIAVRVITLRDLYAETGNTDKIRKLDEIQVIVEESEPVLRNTLAEMEMFSSLWGDDQLKAIVKRYLDRQSTA